MSRRRSPTASRMARKVEGAPRITRQPICGVRSQIRRRSYRKSKRLARQTPAGNHPVTQQEVDCLGVLRYDLGLRVHGYVVQCQAKEAWSPRDECETSFQWDGNREEWRPIPPKPRRPEAGVGG